MPEAQGTPVFPWSFNDKIRLLPKSPRKESGLQELTAGTRGWISCQELPVADDLENRWNADLRIWRDRS